MTRWSSPALHSLYWWYILSTTSSVGVVDDSDNFCGKTQDVMRTSMMLWRLRKAVGSCTCSILLLFRSYGRASLITKLYPKPYGHRVYIGILKLKQRKRNFWVNTYIDNQRFSCRNIENHVNQIRRPPSQLMDLCTMILRVNRFALAATRTSQQAHRRTTTTHQLYFFFQLLLFSFFTP